MASRSTPQARRSRTSPQKPTGSKLQQLLYLALMALVYFILTQTGLLPSDSSLFTPVAEGEWLRLDVIDVGQGDCLLLTSSQGETMLIDAGSRSEENVVLSYLQQQNITKLDYVIATHAHEDHIGSMAAVINKIPIGTFYMPDAVHSTVTFETMMRALENKDVEVIDAVSGLKLPWKAGTAQFLSPKEGVSYKDLNNTSAVLHLQFGETAFLFTGDAEVLAEEEILASHSNIQAQVLKAGHHGSSTSSSKAFLQAVQPQIALISCGKDNSYGHPHRETMQSFQEMNLGVYRTDQQGHITLISDGKEIQVETQR